MNTELTPMSTHNVFIIIMFTTWITLIWWGAQVACEHESRGTKALIIIVSILASLMSLGLLITQLD